MRNLVAALFRLENSRGPDDVCRVLEALAEWLQAGEQSELRRAFVGWRRHVLLPHRLPGVALPEIENLQEVKTMLAERVQEWTRQWWEEGRQEGRQQGEAAILLRQLERKFGPLGANVRERITRADAERLLVWSERVLTATSLEEVLA
jgi:flagellar biosynthesis/type III secretory pathway protein FliH